MKNDMLFLFIRVIFFCVEFICNCKIYCKGFLNVYMSLNVIIKFIVRDFLKKKNVFLILNLYYDI